MTQLNDDLSITITDPVRVSIVIELRDRRGRWFEFAETGARELSPGDSIIWHYSEEGIKVTMS